MSDNYNKIQEVLDYVEVNIKEEVSVERLAEMCSYSSNHFQRLFHSIVGITPVEYIKKRKLASAAWEIIEKDRSILDIAVDYGFSSGEVFTRAFKRVFDITPNGYRKLGIHAIPKDYWKVTFEDSQVQSRYLKAVENLCGRFKKDKNILGAVLLGSLSYDKVWIKSDIEVALIVNDGCKLKSSFCLIEDDIYIYTRIYTRTEFLRDIANSVQGSVLHSTFAHGTLLYSSDDVVQEWMEKIGAVDELGDKDRYFIILDRLSWVLNCLHKAEKWIKIKSDARYAYLWILQALESLADIEVLLKGSVPEKEVILQVLRGDNTLFEKLYIELMDSKKNNINIMKAVESIYGYIRKRKDKICKPLLQYFEKAKEMKAVSTILKDFNNKNLKAFVVSEVCEWLCEEGVLVKDYFDTHITKRSSVMLSEPGYFVMDEDREIFI